MIPLTDDIPTDRLPIVTLALIAANLVVYVISLRHGGSLLGGPSNAVADHYGAIPYQFTHSGSRWATAISSMFLHASPLHLLGNMLFLFIFGNNVEDAMGRLRFLAFYILGGLAALALQIAVDPNSLAPTIGASGAIAAVLGGYILLYPRAKILSLVFIILFFTVVEIPAILMLGIWFAEQAVLAGAGLADPAGAGGGVAYFAHLGGFVFGLLLIKVFATTRSRGPGHRLPGIPV
ncbi:MAG TPA: rhomboid family intramembrane serine protease [Solirubrobacteraceae bacterium]